MLNVIHDASLFGGVLLEVVLEQFYPLFCCAVRNGVFGKVTGVSPCFVEIGAVEMVGAVHHLDFCCFAWYADDADAVCAYRAVGEGGCDVCQVGLVDIGLERAGLSCGRDVCYLYPCVASILII